MYVRKLIIFMNVEGLGHSRSLHILLGFLRLSFTYLEMRCGGGNGEDARAAVRAAKVGFVFQSFQLLGNLNALENVMLPLELQGRNDARAMATTATMLACIAVMAPAYALPRRNEDVLVLLIIERYQCNTVMMQINACAL